MSIILGCIADDFTGATDLAGTLVNSGLRTVQWIGVPDRVPQSLDADAVVVALKSRTIPAKEAVEQSLQALEWLRSAGCSQFVFKYCSTFDSTDQGNIGPVALALLDALGADFSIACPAFPRNGRLVFQGHLFVGDVLLNESGMQDHPLTPMTDPNLVRVLERQSQVQVGLVPAARVHEGSDSIRRAYQELRDKGVRLAIVDALSDADLEIIGEASADLSLITGGSGIAIGLADNYRRAGILGSGGAADSLPEIGGLSAIIAGSCSSATREQVANASQLYPSLCLDPMVLADDACSVQTALDWAREHLTQGPVLIFTSADPDQVRFAQDKFGVEQIGTLVEDCLAQIAAGLVEAGVRRLVVAGGETSGAVVKALQIEGLRIGPEIAPGVPWTVSLGAAPIAVALKSGNFGDPNFFATALECAP